MANDAEATVAKPEGKMGEFVDWIEGISVRELSVLVKALEERLGVSAAMPVAAGGAGAAGAPAAAAAALTVPQMANAYTGTDLTGS